MFILFRPTTIHLIVVFITRKLLLNVENLENNIILVCLLQKGGKPHMKNIHMYCSHITFNNSLTTKNVPPLLHLWWKECVLHM